MQINRVRRHHLLTGNIIWGSYKPLCKSLVHSIKLLLKHAKQQKYWHRHLVKLHVAYLQFVHKILFRAVMEVNIDLYVRLRGQIVRLPEKNM